MPWYFNRSFSTNLRLLFRSRLLYISLNGNYRIFFFPAGNLFIQRHKEFIKILLYLIIWAQKEKKPVISCIVNNDVLLYYNNSAVLRRASAIFLINKRTSNKTVSIFIPRTSTTVSSESLALLLKTPNVIIIINQAVRTVSAEAYDGTTKKKSSK